jgi:hypothetical protein
MPVPKWVLAKERKLLAIERWETTRKWARWTAEGLSGRERQMQSDERLGTPLVFADAISGRPGYVDFLLRRALHSAPPLNPEPGRRRVRKSDKIVEWKKQYGQRAAQIHQQHLNDPDAAFAELDSSRIPVPKLWVEDGFPDRWQDFAEKSQRERASGLLSAVANPKPKRR